MTILQLASILIALAGIIGALNYFLLRLPSAIGVMLIALLASLAILLIDAAFPGLGMAAAGRGFISEVEFGATLLEGMLGLLLFAGALHVKLEDLKEQAWAIALMATLGIAVSAAVVAFGFSWIMGVPIIIALVFGALISPTDPVAVLGLMKKLNLPKSIETKVVGESLFNDGIGYVVFLVIVAIAFGGHGESPGFASAATLFLQETVGGAALGAGLGYLAYAVMRRIDDYSLEVLITLALAFGGYQLAVYLHMSGPIFAVVAGLLIGDVGMRHGMSTQTREYVNSFWTIIDELLNAVLFMLIGFEVFAVTFSIETVLKAVAIYLLVTLARFCAVFLPVTLLRPFRGFTRGTVAIMTLGGLRGGISVALALSLPESEWKPAILAVTYVVVLLSILVNGMALVPLARFIQRPG